MSRNETSQTPLLQAASSSSYLVLAAHPDDETIGLASFLPAWAERVAIVHATDGAPADLHDAQAAGYVSQPAYAQARRREAVTALGIASVPQTAITALGFVDQELSFCLLQLVDRVAELLKLIQPDIVFTHPYEGGHPDHDSLSFCAAEALKVAGSRAKLFEFCSYHASQAGLATDAFLASPPTPVCTRRLDSGQQKMKREMFRAYATQEQVLKGFPVDCERIRPAPAYRYADPPHSGPLHYEGRISSITGELWRRLAFAATMELAS